MSLIEIVLDVAALTIESVVSWTTRGFVVVLSAGALILCGVAAWLILTGSNPPWRMGALAGSIAVGIVGLLVSLMHLLRDESDEPLATACVAINVGAILVPTLWLIVR